MTALILEAVCTADPAHVKRMRVGGPSAAGIAAVAALIDGTLPGRPCKSCGAPLGRYRVLEAEAAGARNGAVAGAKNVATVQEALEHAAGAESFSAAPDSGSG